MSQEKNTGSEQGMWTTHMEILMKRAKRIEVAEVIDEAIWRWYFENGKEVPNWKYKKDPDWWVHYLAELDENK